MKKLLFFILILFLCGSISAQKKEHQEFLKSMKSENLKSLSAGCQMGQTVTEISLNNTRAVLRNTGVLWTNIDGSGAGYEIPKDSGKTSIYAGGLWFGGVDLNGRLKISYAKFVGGRNFWPGPLKSEGVDAGTTDYETCYQYDKFYKVDRQEVSRFRDWYNSSDDERSIDYEAYSIPESIIDWPAHGNVAAGYDYYLAPFWDNNKDGSYNPMDGDYPFFDLDGVIDCRSAREKNISRLYGDQSTWWVYNDNGNIHGNPNSEAVGMEVRAQAFQFSTNDELNDMSFYNFELINRSKYTLVESWLGLYLDGDLGYAFDDRVGCNVQKGIGYFYNGEDIDGTGEEWAYGANPPAIGFDFFEGPYKDPNGMDDCASYDSNNNLICNDCNLNGSINGLNFGDGIVDNERLGMSRFMIYTNYGGCTGCLGPTVSDHYNLLKGFWRDEIPLRYGNFDMFHSTDGPITHYAFPGDSDPCGAGQNGVVMPPWTDEMSIDGPGDRRLLQSSGPFTMEPGSITDLTMGIVWARSNDGDPQASVDKMFLADDKAQALFDNCFRIVDGPDAPELTILEQDNKLIFNIWNKPNSNNYLERYQEKDPYIVCPGNDPECDTEYKFQGYQIWQLKDHTVTLQDAVNGNPDKARLIFQCDIRDGIRQIVNHEWDQKMQTNVPKLEVDGTDLGVEHSFVVEEDLFSKGSDKLVNFKDYYYVALAYAHNDYQAYNQNDADSYSGQKQPYKAGRKGADGTIKIYKATPHKESVEILGIVQSRNGDSPSIKQIEGHGSGSNILDLSTESHDAIMSGPPWKVDELEFEPGRGPIDVRVIDPINTIRDVYILKFDSVDYFKGAIMNGKVIDATWYIYNSKGDTVFSESAINRNYDQLIPDWGLSVNITQEKIPYQSGAIDNGFLEATMEFDDPVVQWLSFIPDDERHNARNWIRSGGPLGYGSLDYDGDRDEVYEKLLGGTWAPFKQVFSGINGLSFDRSRNIIDSKSQRLASVDIYFTPDRDLWTRSPVIETTDEETFSIGNVEKFELRDEQSIDKWGRMAEEGIGPDTVNVEAASYISETGMGWFPGYAIDVNTGERLNVVYGESSWLTGDNGADMMWNPSPREGSKIYMAKQGVDVDPLDVFFGGKHFIYIMGHNDNHLVGREKDYFPKYDAGKYFIEKMQNENPRTNRYAKRDLFVNAMWCTIPLLNPDHFNEDDIKDDPYGFVKNELKIRIRVVDQYCVDVLGLAKPDSTTLNSNQPMYTFNTHALSPVRINADFSRLLDLVNVVPNPYYGSSGYSHPDYESGVKIINLPKSCTISIFSLSGNLVRRIIRDDWSTYIHWDLKNDYGIPISSGVYIIHIEAPGLGEKTLKWMGSIK